MNAKKYIEEMKNIQENLISYIDNEENYKNLINIFQKINIHEDKFKIKSLFHLLLQISNNYHRESDFFSKIERIIQQFKEDIKKYFSNTELYLIFQSNKRLLLFLIEEKIMIFDKYVAKQIIDDKYPQYFSHELQQFVNEKWFKKKQEKDTNNDDDIEEEEEEKDINNWVKEIKEKELPENFFEKRKVGENDSYICELIRKDSLDDFIIFLNQNGIPFDCEIEPSIYETNLFLLNKSEIKLIEYAVFFGSISIKYNFFLI